MQARAAQSAESELRPRHVGLRPPPHLVTLARITFGGSENTSQTSTVTVRVVAVRVYLLGDRSSGVLCLKYLLLLMVRTLQIAAAGRSSDLLGLSAARGYLTICYATGDRHRVASRLIEESQVSVRYVRPDIFDVSSRIGGYVMAASLFFRRRLCLSERGECVGRVTRL